MVSEGKWLPGCPRRYEFSDQRSDESPGRCSFGSALILIVAARPHIASRSSHPPGNVADYQQHHSHFLAVRPMVSFHQAEC